MSVVSVEDSSLQRYEYEFEQKCLKMLEAGLLDEMSTWCEKFHEDYESAKPLFFLAIVAYKRKRYKDAKHLNEKAL